MSHEILLEIGLEEMPARFVRQSSEQLAEKVRNWLRDQRIDFGDVRTYATPRRLAVRVENVADKQKDVEEEAKGPSKKIALDENGEWTKAAQGFAKGRGISVDELYFREFKGEPYVFANVKEEGKKTKDQLPGLQHVVTSLTFPKNMRWGSYPLRYIRPIRWITALCDHEVIAFTITEVTSGNRTQGHRFLGTPQTVSHPQDYVDVLQEQYVLADMERRKQLIVDQIKELETQKQWHIPLTEDLLEEVTHLVEYPTVLYGSFSETFLSIPEDVLVTSMREHQRYFSVRDAEGRLLPYFVTVRNGDATNGETVAKGNEKVLRARLADARFFYEEDQKRTISECVAQLESIVFHEDLGTVGDKVRRIREISSEWSTILSLDEKTTNSIQRTAEISKFDLVTQMVDEFSELQGFMGEDYALKAGEDPEVARGVFEHYLPRFSGDRTPASVVGAVVGLSDKLDTIVGSFSVGIVPTGSQDPYGLRRQAAGVVQIVLAHGWKISLDTLLHIVLTIHENRGLLQKNRNEIFDELLTFFRLRVKNDLQEKEIRYDVIDAVLHRPSTDLNVIVERAETLMRRMDAPAFKEAVESFTRVYNLAKKAEPGRVNADNFEHEAEQELYNAYLAVQENPSLEKLETLKEPIDRFFDRVMVMAEDRNVQQNRLALLYKVSSLIQTYADFTKLVLT